MAGIKTLRKLQFGRETTAGTIVAATTLWRGMGVLEDTRETVFPEENVGLISGTDRSYVARLGALLALDEVEATFEQLPHLLEMGIKAATPVQDGAGAGYVRTYAFPTTTGTTVKTYTIEGGDNQDAEVSEYCFAQEINLTGAKGEAWKNTATIIGRQVVPQAFTAAVPIPDVEELRFGNTKLYIDEVTGTMGTTLKAMTLLGAAVKITTGQTEKYAADGNLFFSFINSLTPEITLTLTMEHNAISVAEKAKFRAGTARLIRLLIEGASFTAGTVYSKKTVVIDMAGKYTSFGPLDDQDGNDILEAEMSVRYNSTAAEYARIISVIPLAALP